jgi:hypothetical protein
MYERQLVIKGKKKNVNTWNYQFSKNRTADRCRFVIYFLLQKLLKVICQNACLNMATGCPEFFWCNTAISTEITLGRERGTNGWKLQNVICDYMATASSPHVLSSWWVIVTLQNTYRRVTKHATNTSLHFVPNCLFHLITFFKYCTQISLCVCLSTVWLTTLPPARAV